MKNPIKFFAIILAFVLSSCTTNIDEIELFPVKMGKKWGYIDKSGKFVINPQFDYAYNFSEGIALIVADEGKIGFIGEDGNFIISPIYVDANFFSDGLACVVLEDGKPQYIDKKGNVVITVENAENCFGFKEGLARIEMDGKWGFIDKTGKLVVNPIYEKALDFNEGLAAVAKRNQSNVLKWGYIDKSGLVKIDFQFAEGENEYCVPGSFSEGLASVSSDGSLWGFINKEGKFIINPQFDVELYNFYLFKNGFSLAMLGGNYGFIDKKGNYAINPQFKDAGPFFSKELAVVQNSNGLFGFINREGNYEINPQFEFAFPFFGDIAFVKSTDKYGLIDKKGKYIVNPQFDDYIFPFIYNIGVTSQHISYRQQLEEQARLDSIRISDSIALVEAEQVRIQDSINAAMGVEYNYY